MTTFATTPMRRAALHANQPISQTAAEQTKPQDVLRAVASGIGAVLGAPGRLEDMANQAFANATNAISQALPSFPAGTLGSMALGLPHAHTAHPPSGPPPVPPTPLPPFGPVLLGTSVSVLIGGIPAARSGDLGFCPTCCGLPPMFEVFTGSSKVFISGKRAARVTDITFHCKPAAGGGGGGAAAAGGAMAAVGAVAGVAGKVAQVAGVAADVMDAEEGDVGAQARLAVMAAQAAADAIAKALSAAMGKDPCVPPGTVGMVTVPMVPSVLIGGFPMPTWGNIAKGFMKLLKGRKKRPAPKAGPNGAGRDRKG